MNEHRYVAKVTWFERHKRSKIATKRIVAATYGGLEVSILSALHTYASLGMFAVISMKENP